MITSDFSASGSCSINISADGKPSGCPPSLRSRLSSSMRSFVTPSKDTTRASAMRTSSRIRRAYAVGRLRVESAPQGPPGGRQDGPAGRQPLEVLPRPGGAADGRGRPLEDAVRAPVAGQGSVEVVRAVRRHRLLGLLGLVAGAGEVAVEQRRGDALAEDRRDRRAPDPALAAAAVGRAED